MEIVNSYPLLVNYSVKIPDLILSGMYGDHQADIDWNYHGTKKQRGVPRHPPDTVIKINFRLLPISLNPIILKNCLVALEKNNHRLGNLEELLHIGMQYPWLQVQEESILTFFKSCHGWSKLRCWRVAYLYCGWDIDKKIFVRGFNDKAVCEIGEENISTRPLSHSIISRHKLMVVLD